MTVVRRRGRAPSAAPLRIGFFGILGSGNWGNDGSLEVVLSDLRDRFPDASLGFMAMDPGALQLRYGAPSVPLQWYEAHADRLARVPGPVLKVVGRLLDPFRTLSWVRGLDVVVVPGAGVLETTTPTRPWALPYSLLALGLACRGSGTRLALVSVGADARPTEAAYRVLAAAARSAHYRSYRDELSRRTVRDMGIDVRHDEVYTDLAFGLETPALLPADSRVVGIGVMNYRGASGDRHRADELHEAYRGAVERLLGLLLADGWTVRLFTGDREDEEVLRRIRDRALEDRPDAGDRVSAEVVGSLAELMDVMSRVDLVVASRYHNVLCALKLGLPTVSLSYASKNDELMASMGLAAFCQPADRIDEDRLAAQVRELDQRRDELIETLAAANRGHATEVARQLEDLAKYLES